MKIPTKVKVGKTRYDIVTYPFIMGCRGVIIYEDKQIQISEQGCGYKFTKKEMYNTFWHELTHAILKDMNHKLERDEKFVSNFADRLTDAITSARFES